MKYSGADPTGAFLFVEGLCEMPIAESLGDYLVAQARQRAAQRAEIDLRRSRPVKILALPAHQAVRHKPARDRHATIAA